MNLKGIKIRNVKYLARSTAGDNASVFIELYDVYFTHMACKTSRRNSGSNIPDEHRAVAP